MAKSTAVWTFGVTVRVVKARLFVTGWTMGLLFLTWMASEKRLDNDVAS